jgi:hypothetical protein
VLDLTKGRVVFDEASHTYRAGGVEILGVTRALALAGYVDTTWFTEWCSKRGTVVHKAVELEAIGLYEPESWRDDLEEAGLEEDRIEGLLGHVEAWRRFRQETGFEFLREEDGARLEPEVYSEVRLISESRGFAGTADGIGTFRGQAGLVLADWKSGPPGPSTGPQTAAYASMYHELTGRRIVKRLGVQLRPDGHFRHHYYDDPADFHDFEAALRVARWRLRHLPKEAVREAA